MDSTQTPLRHVSHCFGYGGIDLALKGIFGRGIVTIAACEIEAYCIANGLTKSEEGLLDVELPFWTDLKTFPFGQFYGLVDIYSAGFSCQPFSCAGKQEADNDPRHLWPYIRDGIERMQPDHVLLENVRGIITSKLKGEGWSDPPGTPVLLHVLRELERINYSCQWGIFSAAEVGATHRRQRVFILARRKGARELADSMRDEFRGQEWKEGSWRRVLQTSHGNDGHLANSQHDAGSTERRIESRERGNTSPEQITVPGRSGDGTVGDSTGARLRDGKDSRTDSSDARSDGSGSKESERDGRTVENPDSIGRREGNAPEPIETIGRVQPESTGEQLVNSHSDGRGEGRSKPELRSGRSSAGIPGGAVANAESIDGRSQFKTPGSECGRTGPSGSSGAMADSNSSGQCERWRPEPVRQEQSAAERGLPEFPPGPKDIEGWRRVLAIDPSLAPATPKIESEVCLLADGNRTRLDTSEFRIDQLRACGNGVVPKCAAKAFVTLYQKFNPVKTT